MQGVKDLVSVIVPVHNTAPYLEKCLNSLMNQTYQNTEILMVENNSTDESYDMCCRWAEKDNRFKALQVTTKGVAAARNYALDIAKGEYILFVDSDDWCELDMIQRLMDVSVAFNADIVMCDYQVNECQRIHGKDFLYRPEELMQQICRGFYQCGVLWNKLYKRSVIADIRMPDYVCSEDLVFNYYVFCQADVIAGTEDNLYHYFQNENSTVHGNFGIGAFDAFKAREIIFKEVQNTALEPYAVCGLITSCFVVLSGVITSGRCTEKYDELRAVIMKYRFTILTSALYSVRDKFKTIVLSVSKKLYTLLVTH